MTGRTTRLAALGAGALLSLGILAAAVPAGASDGVQTDATVSAGTADAVTQTLGLVNQACVDAANVTAAGTSALASDHGISVAAQPAGSGLDLAVSLPKLTDSLPLLGSLPVVGSIAGKADAQPLKISCAAAGDGSSLGVSAAGVDALVHAIAPGLDLSSLDLSGLLPVDVAASTQAGANPSGTSATVAAPAPAAATASGRLTAQSPAVRASASAPARAATGTANLAAQPASSSGGIVAQTIGSPGALARTGAGVGFLGLLGAALVGSGRLVAFSRKLLRIG